MNPNPENVGAGGVDDVEEQLDQFSEQLVECYREISILQEASEALGQLLDRERIAEAALATALRVSGAARGGFFTIERGTGHSLASVGQITGTLPEGWITALESRLRPLIQNRPERGALGDLAAAAPGATNLLMAPLVGQEKLVGILALLDAGRGDFESGDAKMVQAIAKQAATALNNEEHHRHLLQTQEELLTSQKLAAMGEMAAEIGHELNNYLTSILGQVEIIQVLLETSPGKALEPKLGSIVNQIDKMTVLTQGLLRCSRQQIKPKESRIRDIVQETIAFVSPQNRFDHARFEVSFPEDLPTVFLDPNQLQQVFLNLFTNAADAMGETGGTVSVTGSLSEDGQSLEISVSDEGPGIPPELHSRIFEPRFTTKAEGNGVGLAVCFRVMSDHGGSIRVASGEGRGATFFLTLPLTGPAPAPAPSEDEAAADVSDPITSRVVR